MDLVCATKTGACTVSKWAVCILLECRAILNKFGSNAGDITDIVRSIYLTPVRLLANTHLTE